MTKAQARRLSLWVNGTYMLGADHTGFADGELDDEQMDKVMAAQEAIARDMIARSGIPASIGTAEAIRMVLAGERA